MNIMQAEDYPMILPLSALRFFVIVLIYFHHLSYPGGLGPAAVTFFFVLSGFIMAYNNNSKFVCLDVERLKSFYIKRLSGLYPLHILTFIVSIPIVYVTNFKTNILYTLANIFLLQSYFPNGAQVFAFNGLSWFLADIIFFYFVTPFALFFLFKLNAEGNNKTLLSLLVFLFICEIGLAYPFINKIEPYSFGWWFIYISPYFRIFDYMIGLVLGLIFISSKGSVAHHLVISRILFSALEVISILFFVYSFYWIRFIPYPSLQMGTYFIPFCTLVIYVFSFQRGIISLILSNKIFVYLGGLSFTIYLTHQLVISYTAIVFSSPIHDIAADIKKIAAQLLLLFVIICLSDVLVRYFEQPMKKLLLRKTTLNRN
jgi:peptidoglycan/LPS O-acetylase OafA/YrhL